MHLIGALVSKICNELTNAEVQYASYHKRHAIQWRHRTKNAHPNADANLEARNADIPRKCSTMQPQMQFQTPSPNQIRIQQCLSKRARSYESNIGPKGHKQISSLGRFWLHTVAAASHRSQAGAVSLPSSTSNPELFPKT